MERPFETSGAARPDDAQLVVIRPGVIENADHVFGNLFQRLYHCAERARALNADLGRDLDESSRDIEACLQLVLDYVAPFPPSVQTMPLTEVIESFTHQLYEALGEAPRADLGAAESARVSVDPGRLGRAFSLMIQRLERTGGGARGLAVAEVGSDVGLTLRLAPDAVALRTSVGDLRWAVAEKLIDLHGGSLAENRSEADGEVTWNVLLPRDR